ncbi:MAG: NnrS family protein [Sulfuriflexus sp.]|nr:NnrS family protein [Sulfuriflexus sp.]
MQIEENKSYRISLLHLGFRPFFLLGSVFAVIAVALWLWILSFGGWLASSELTIFQWHAHEMLYGYTLAVIAGFLLTAVGNWTGEKTISGVPLLLLALCWLLARVMPLIDHPQAMLIMASLDIVFNVILCIAILVPILKVRQWKHLSIWTKIVFLLAGNILFYLGLFNILENGIQLGIYAALYIILSLIMLMGRRVIPFFIERGVESPVTLVNYRWLDLSSLFLMLAFIIVEVFVVMPVWATIIAAILAVLHGIRLYGWYAKGIWQRPLLWSLYVGYGWMVAGFVLRALSGWIELNPMFAVHAFTYGGIGMLTIGMMARVALGHTGRDVFNPPKVLNTIFILLFSGSVVRVILPIIFPNYYSTLILVSQVLWIVAFIEFVLTYSSMLIKPRVDGKHG